jgi:4-aminobutyrate--pyruvate transaminase
LISQELFEGIAEGSGRIGTLGHGFTSTGHPVAAAVALENLDIIEERGLIEHAAAMAPALQNGLRKLSGHPLVGEVRGLGLIAGVELVQDKETKQGFDPPGQAGAYLLARAQERGLILRPIQDTLAFCPPLIISEAEIDKMVAIFEAALEETWNWVQENRQSQTKPA